MVDPESRLKGLVENNATVSSLYGGFEIVVTNPPKLKWHKIFFLLLELDHEVWVRRKDEKLAIVSKPPSV